MVKLNTDNQFKEANIMAKKGTLRSGMGAPRRGTYIEIGPRGGVKRTVEMPRKDATMPPTEKPNSSFRKG